MDSVENRNAQRKQDKKDVLKVVVSFAMLGIIANCCCLDTVAGFDSPDVAVLQESFGHLYSDPGIKGAILTLEGSEEIHSANGVGGTLDLLRMYNGMLAHEKEVNHGIFYLYNTDVLKINYFKSGQRDGFRALITQDYEFLDEYIARKENTEPYTPYIKYKQFAAGKPKTIDTLIAYYKSVSPKKQESFWQQTKIEIEEVIK